MSIHDDSEDELNGELSPNHDEELKLSDENKSMNKQKSDSTSK